MGDGKGHVRGHPSVSGCVLVADDLAVFRRALVRQLRVAGINACGVATLDELKQYLEMEPPRAVLLDWYFGGCTAEDVLQLLRSRWIPVMVLTGDPDGVDITGVPVLGKPVEFSLLRDRLAEMVGAPAPETRGGSLDQVSRK